LISHEKVPQDLHVLKHLVTKTFCNSGNKQNFNIINLTPYVLYMCRLLVVIKNIVSTWQNDQLPVDLLTSYISPSFLLSPFITTSLISYVPQKECVIGMNVI